MESNIMESNIEYTIMGKVRWGNQRPSYIIERFKAKYSDIGLPISLCERLFDLFCNSSLTMVDIMLAKDESWSVPVEFNNANEVCLPNHIILVGKDCFSMKKYGAIIDGEFISNRRLLDSIQNFDNEDYEGCFSPEWREKALNLIKD